MPATVPSKPNTSHTQPCRLPETTPHAVIVTLHGFNDYSNAFAEIGPRLAENGIATIAYDQRGFGASDQAGDWPGGDRLRDDVRAAIEAVHTAYPGARVYAMGESMGGAVLMSAWADAALRRSLGDVPKTVQ